MQWLSFAFALTGWRFNRRGWQHIGMQLVERYRKTFIKHHFGMVAIQLARLLDATGMRNHAKVGGAANIYPRDIPPPGVRERRSTQRRLKGNRRRSPRLSSILPDRRKVRGRRHMDLCG